ncbi:hypothetical protein SAMN02787142_0569 [Burkholderia sp. WP9]|nr:hypothetical protein SAMN02787142_0569 [Burkholderia sp. WP9]
MGLKLMSYAMMDTGCGSPTIVSGVHTIGKSEAGPAWGSLLRLKEELSCKPCTECGISVFYAWKFNKDGQIGEYLLQLVEVCLAYPNATLSLVTFNDEEHDAV